MSNYVQPIKPLKLCKFAMINLRASPLALVELECFLDSHNPDLVLVADPPKRLKTGGYKHKNFLWIPSPCGSESVAGIFIEQHIKFEFLCKGDGRNLAIQMDSVIGKIGVISTYLQPDSLNGLEGLIDCIKTSKKMCAHTLVGGDFNSHSYFWSEVDSNSQGERIEELLIENDLYVLNHRNSPPTFIDYTGKGHWIDVTLASCSLLDYVRDWIVVPGEVPHSDHDIIIFDINTAPERKGPTLKRDWKNCDWDAFNRLLFKVINSSDEISPPIHTAAEVDTCLKHLNASILAVTRQLVKWKRISPHSKEWFDKEVKEAHVQMKSAKAAVKDDDSKMKYDETRSKFRSLVSQKKQESFRKFCNSVGSSDMWTALKRLSGCNQSFHIPFLESENGTLTSSADIACELASRYFPDYSEEEQQRLKALDLDPTRLRPDEEWFIFDQISPFELEMAIDHSKSKGATGDDNISNLLLKKCKRVLMPHMLELFSGSLRCGYYPSDWRIAKVISIQKPGTKPTSKKSFRPISLLSCCSKIFEAIIGQRLLSFVESTNILSNAQFGFRKKRSTTLPLWKVVDKAFKCFNNRSSLAAVALDLSSAFDRVSTTLLISKLKTMNTPPYLLAILKSYLSNRKAHLSVNEDEFIFSPKRGLPQGSCLSPLLFILYINDISRLAEEGVDLLMYADDVLALTEYKDVQDHSRLQTTLDRLSLWAVENFMEFNVDKTQTIIFQRNRQNLELSLTLQGQPVPASLETIKYLGLNLDKGLYFHKHLESVLGKAYRRLYTIKKLSRVHWGLLPWISRHLFIAAVQPAVLYGAEVWAHRISIQYFSNKLDRVSRLGALMITGCYSVTSSISLFMLAEISPLSLLVTARLLQFSPTLFHHGIHPSQAPGGTHLSPANLLWTEERRLSKSCEDDTSPSQIFNESLRSNIGKRFLKGIVLNYIINSSFTHFSSSDFGHGLKELQWEFRCRTRLKPWFQGSKWDRRSVSTINQFLSDHWRPFSTIDKDTEDLSCPLCMLDSFTRKHLWECPYLDCERREFLISEKDEDKSLMKFEELGILLCDSSDYDNLIRFLQSFLNKCFI